MYLSALGRFDEAMREIGRARDLDPLSPVIASNVGAIYFTARRYDEALAAIDTAIEMHQDFRTAYQYRGWVLLSKGAYAEALSALVRAAEASARGHVVIDAALGFAHAKLGDRQKALTIAAALTDLYEKAYASAYWIAFLYLGLGDRPKVLEWLERACDDRDGWLRVLKAAAFFDEVRDTPRFQGVLKRIGRADL